MSKELEAIEWLETKCYVESPQDETFDKCINIIKQALLKAQEQEKVFEIIKEKDVDIKFLKSLINSNSEYTRENALKIYNIGLDSEKLNEEEFELLKRCLDEKN
jgi:hypothetical protein